jgi:hypothetical protein
MPIETRSAPAGVAHQLATALEDIAPTPLGARTLEARPLEISKPLPVYTLGLQDAAAGNFPEGAKMVGWRYLLAGPAVATADINAKEQEGTAAFNKLTHGANADRLSAALHVAEQKYGGSIVGFEARILDLPALNLGAVWLAGAQSNVFIPYLDESRLSGAPPSIEMDFISKVESAAKRQVQRMRGREPNAP